MRRQIAATAPALALVALIVAAACGGDGPGQPTPTVSPSPSHTATASPSPTSTGEPTASPSPTPTPTPTVEPTATATPSPSPTPTPPPAGFYYTVQQGDTLYSIAQRYGTTVAAIVTANGIADPSRIYVGQVLFIPGAGPQPSPTATPSGVAQVIRKGDASRRIAVLTFDAGSDAGYTSQILDTLKAEGIKASFGLTGRWAEQNPQLLKRIVAEGHSLINHSYDHASFTGLSTGAAPLTQAQRWDELDRTEQIVNDLSGATTKPYFRPPYGDYDDSVNRDIYARGYRYNVMWTVDSRGWQGIPAAQIVSRCLDLAEPGAIYVFHVGSASQDGPALPDIIDGLRADGYTFVHLPEAL